MDCFLIFSYEILKLQKKLKFFQVNPWIEYNNYGFNN